MAFERDVKRGMNMNSIEDDERRDGFREADAESANGAHFFIVGSVNNAAIGGDRQTSLAFQILAEGGVEGLSGRCADSVGTRPQDQRRPIPRLPNGKEIREGAELAGQRVVFQSGGESRREPIGQRRAQAGAIDLIRRPTRAEGPAFFKFVTRPADRAAFSRSSRSTGYEGSALEGDRRVLVFFLSLAVFVLC